MTTDLFSLESKISDLPSINGGVIKPVYQEVSSQKANTGTNFPLGQQSYKWSVSGNTRWSPKNTHFVVRITLSNVAGDDLVDNPRIAPAMGLMSNLFSSAELRLGGKTVQRVTQFLPAIDSLLHRTTKSKPYLDTIGEASNFWNNDFGVRVSEVSSTEGVGGRRTYKFDLIWKPPLMLFHTHDGYIPSGEAEILLTPQSRNNYKKTVIENYIAAGEAPLVAGVDYEFSVDKMVLHVATVEGPRYDDGTYALSLDHIDCQSSKIQTDSLTQQYLTVSPSTTALVVAYQDERTTENWTNPSRLSVAPATTSSPNDPASNLSLGLTRLYVQYAGVTKPQIDANPEYKSLEVDRTVERYYESLDECGMLSNTAGAESLQDWQTRGPFHWFSWARDSTDASTRVQVNSEFGGLQSPGTQNNTNMNMLLFSISTTSAKITVRDGSIVTVEQL